MKSFLFFLVAIGILVVLWYFSYTVGSSAEGFQDQAQDQAQAQGETPPPGANPGMNIPLISPRQQTLGLGEEVNAFAPPSATLLAPPPGQTASVNTRPFEDPAMEKAGYGDVKQLQESMIGFLNNEAPGLQELGDPSIQLPLQTARSDKARLDDELAVLDRNPGLESSLTTQDLFGIQANLSYLQKKWRLSANSMLPSDTGDSVEGFEGFQSGNSYDSSGNTITLQDLINLTNKIAIEIVRLQSAGSTDTTTQARVNSLTKIKQSVDDTIDQVSKGIKKINDVNLTKEDIAAFLPTMSNTNTPIPDIISSLGGSSYINNLFPTYATGDASGAEVAQKLFNQYGESLFNNLSWDVSLDLNYTSPGEQYVAQAEAATAFANANTIANIGSVPGYDPSSNISDANAPPVSGGSRGLFDSVIQQLTSAFFGSGSKSDEPLNAIPTTDPGVSGGGGAPGPFDWRTRANHICEQVTARGFDPIEFGCLKDPEEVSENFSWRGYAKMVCSRIATIYDPSVPEMCGCPPPTWPGWRP